MRIFCFLLLVCFCLNSSAYAQRSRCEEYLTASKSYAESGLKAVKSEALVEALTGSNVEGVAFSEDEQTAALFGETEEKKIQLTVVETGTGLVTHKTILDQYEAVGYANYTDSSHGPWMQFSKDGSKAHVFTSREFVKHSTDYSPNKQVPLQVITYDLLNRSIQTKRIYVPLELASVTSAKLVDDVDQKMVAVGFSQSRHEDGHQGYWSAGYFKLHDLSSGLSNQMETDFLLNTRGPNFKDFAISPDGEMVAAMYLYNGPKFSVWDARTGQHLKELAALPDSLRHPWRNPLIRFEVAGGRVSVKGHDERGGTYQASWDAATGRLYSFQNEPSDYDIYNKYNLYGRPDFQSSSGNTVVLVQDAAHPHPIYRNLSPAVEIWKRFSR